MFSCPILVVEIDIVRGFLLTVYIDHEAFSKPLLKARKEMHDHMMQYHVNTSRWVARAAVSFICCHS